jgi:hypothetical protein
MADQTPKDQEIGSLSVLYSNTKKLTTVLNMVITKTGFCLRTMRTSPID